MGNLHWLLAIQINLIPAGISLPKTSYIIRILIRFDVSLCNPVSTSLETNEHLPAATLDDPRANAIANQQKFSSLIHLVTATHSDLAYTISTFLSTVGFYRRTLLDS